jgi:subtilase family serine protease
VGLVNLSATHPRPRARTPAAGTRMWLALPAACLAVAAVAITVALSGALSTNAAPSAGAASPLRLVGRAPAAQRIRFTLLLALPGAARLHTSLAALENPRSPQFRHFIDPKSFGARFGISTPGLRALERRLAADGLTITASFPQRTALAVSGTVGTVQRLLRVRIAAYADRAGRRYHAPLGRPIVPAALARTVDGVTGLDTRPRWLAHDVPMGGLTPMDAATAYDITALHNAGILGQGESIAIVSFSAFDPSDPAAFASQYGITGPAPQVISVDGGTTDTSGATEANLDIDVVRTIAPQAQILFYEVPQTSSAYTDVINRIVADHRATIISSSWGECELGLDPNQRAGDSRALSAAVASGVSMFVATGDSGAYDCQQGDLTDHRLSVDWPASSADTIAVGGTRLYLNADYSYLTEGAWDDVLSAAGGGGGFTTGDARPSWQTGPGVLTSLSNGRRQLPDVAGAADPGTPWSVVSGGQLGEVGGTSAATPFWAASMLLIHQYAANRGVGALGYVDPILYALAASTQPFPPFHDVTFGGNRYYQAGPGWDPATGLGSPDVYDLARDMVSYLRAHGAH